MRWELAGGRVIEVVEGDITRQEVGAIVNAANSGLMGGGGVDGAIHRAGGPAILAECRAIRAGKYPEGLPAGEAVVTTGGNLRALHVIHTVGPVYEGGGHGEAEVLGRAYRNSLKLADELGVGSVAFPAISTGVYGYPMEEAARLAFEAVTEVLARAEHVRTVRFVLFGAAAQAVFERAGEGLLGPGGGA